MTGQFGSSADWVVRRCELPRRLISMLSGSHARYRLLRLAAIALLSAPAGFGQQGDGSQEGASLVKAVQNPVASLVSVPIQDNLKIGRAHV